MRTGSAVEPVFAILPFSSGTISATIRINRYLYSAFRYLAVAHTNEKIQHHSFLFIENR